MLSSNTYILQKDNIASSIAPSAAYSLAPTILAVMMILAGFLALTDIILDSRSKMINQIMNSQKEFPISKTSKKD